MTNQVTVTDELIHAAQGGDSDAMWQILSAYESVLVGIVRSVAPGARKDDAEDLLQEARAVLIQHVRDYNTGSSSAALSTFAYRAVRRAVAEEWVRATVGLTIEPTAALRVRQALWTTEGDIEGAWMLVSSDQDPRKCMARTTFLAVVEALAETRSLDEPAGAATGHDGHADLTLSDTLPDASTDFESSTDRRDLARWLVSQVSPRQALALRAFYGMGMERRPDAEVCADMEIKPVSLRRLRNLGVERARSVATAHGIAA
ncbi:sigma factor [Streptomyces roseus]|uniref:sigma factor n=1 Tax=Streptomyces roseus TaxID=66430 RepID=UPI0033FE3EE8